MAEKKNTQATTEEMVHIDASFLPKHRDPKLPKEEFYSVNFKNYIIQRGVAMDIPKSLYELIVAQKKLEDEALDYVDSIPVKE